MSDIYVWVWLPDAVNPIVGGVLRRNNQGLNFRYANGYLAQPSAVSLG